MPFLDRENKDRIYYECKGEGDTIVLLHGLRSNLAWWNPIFLSKLSSKFRILLIDFRGSGRSTNYNNASFTFEDLAQDVILILNHLEIQFSHLLGFSMGGRVVQSLLVNFPDLFGKSILACSLCEAKNYQVRDSYKKMTSKEFVRFFLPRFFTQDFINNNPDKVTSFLSRADRYDTPFETYENQLKAIPLFQGCKVLKTVKHEVLILYGEEDSFISPENSKSIHLSLPNSILLPIKNTGHFIFDSNNLDNITNLILKFLQGIPL